MSITNKIKRAIQNPHLVYEKLQFIGYSKLSRGFANAAFYLQGQMDIHPDSAWYHPKFVDEFGGFYPKNDEVERKISSLEPWDNVRKDMIVLLLRTITERQVKGAMAELGVYKGGTSRLIHHYAPERELFLFDTFEGFDSRDLESTQATQNESLKSGRFSDTSLNAVKTFIAPQNENVKLFKGYFPESIPAELSDRKYAFVSLDADLYDPIMSGLRYFYPKMNQGGMLLVHDYNAWIGARRAVDEFANDIKETPIPMPDKSGSALIVKS